MSVTLYRRGLDASTSSDIQALDSLQRQYRSLEYSRRGGDSKLKGDDGNGTIIRVQKHLIDKLKRDRDRLKTELSIETRQARSINNHYEASQIVRLQDQGDLYGKLIESEKRKIEEFEKKVAKLQQSIAAVRKETGGINAAREANEATQKQIKILENRLDKALVKLNESLANNKNLRFSIDNLRRERVVFDGIYKKLERELMDKKAKMNEILHVSQAAYQAKKEAEEDLIQMKSKAESEQVEFEMKWNELGQLIQEDRQMKLYLRAKEQSRAVKLFGNPLDSPLGSPWRNHLEEEQRMKKKIIKQRSAIQKDKENIEIAKQRVDEYESSFSEIQKATKIADIEELVKVFVNAEDVNFQLFNYVNELSAQITAYEENMGKLQTEIESFQHHAAPFQVQDHQRNTMLNELNYQLEATARSTGLFQSKYQNSLKLIQNLKEGIVGIYQQLECDQMEAHQKLVELFGQFQQKQDNEKDNEQRDSTANEEKGLKSRLHSIPQYYGLTETNLLKYLGMIEVRSNQLLKEYVKLRAEEHVEEEAMDNERMEIEMLEERIKSIEEEIKNEEQYDELEEEEEDELRKQAVQVNLTDPQELRKKMAGSKYYRRKSSIAGTQNDKNELDRLKQEMENKESVQEEVEEEEEEQLEDEDEEDRENGRYEEKPNKRKSNEIKAQAQPQEPEPQQQTEPEPEPEPEPEQAPVAEPAHQEDEYAEAFEAEDNQAESEYPAEIAAAAPSSLVAAEDAVAVDASPRSPEPVVVNDEIEAEQRM